MPIKQVPGFVPVFDKPTQRHRKLKGRVTWADAFRLVLDEKAMPIKFTDLKRGIVILENHGSTTIHPPIRERRSVQQVH